MIVFEAIPELADPALHPDRLTRSPDVAMDLYSRLFRPSGYRHLEFDGDGVALQDVSPALLLRVKRTATPPSSTMDDLGSEGALGTLLGTLDLLRMRPDTELRHLVIPGQTRNSSLLNPSAPMEGTVVVLFMPHERDFREVDGTDGPTTVGSLRSDLHRVTANPPFSYMDIDPIPMVGPVSHPETGRVIDGLWATADARGILVDMMTVFAHSGYAPNPDQMQDIVQGEAERAIVELAKDHAARSLDLALAAKFTELVANPSIPVDERADALAQLRSAQLRLQSRAILASMEVHEWDTHEADDSFRFSHLMRQISARRDTEVSERFAAFQPLFEASHEDFLRVDRERAESRSARIREFTGIAAAVVGGAALVGLFAALAAVPSNDSPVAFSPFWRAAIATLVIAGGIALMAWGAQKLISHRPPSAAWPLRWLGVLASAAGVALGLYAWMFMSAPGADVFGAVLVLLLVGSGLVLLCYQPEARSQGSQPARSG